MHNNNNLTTYIHNFFEDYLTLQKGFSRHTVMSYRDSIKLLLTYSANYKKKSITDLSLADLSQNMVVDFLRHLEEQRKNSIQTRNVRLACLHSFFYYIATRDPLLFDQCHNILTIPFKRAPIATVEYLEQEEIKAILAAVDRKSLDGHRDYTLLFFMYNTGARVDEVITLHTKALQLERPFQVRILGKGRKERLCPLWPETINLLRSLLKQRKIDSITDAPVFVNHRGEALTRFGVRYLLNKYVQIAARNCTSLKRKRIHPHSLRHGCAMALLESGVDINTIRAWLGHVNLETTNRYAEINLDMKRKILNKYLPVSKTNRPWKQNKDLIQWLKSL